MHQPVDLPVSMPERSGKPLRRTFTTQELFGSGQELLIIHAGEEYRLRITSNKKLILTK